MHLFTKQIYISQVTVKQIIQNQTDPSQVTIKQAICLQKQIHPSKLHSFHRFTKKQKTNSSIQILFHP